MNCPPRNDGLDFSYHRICYTKRFLTVLGCTDNLMAVKVRKECMDPGKNTVLQFFTLFGCGIFLREKIRTAIVIEGKNVASSSTQRRKHYCCLIHKLKTCFNVIFM